MKPVNQLLIHDPDNGVLGDCFRASIASLVEMPAYDVPHFVSFNEYEDQWQEQLYNFLDHLGFGYIEIHSYPDDYWERLFRLMGDTYHIISGPSPRFPDCTHCVVGLNGKIIHDPHPDKSGLAEPKKDWVYGFLIAKEMLTLE